MRRILISFLAGSFLLVFLSDAPGRVVTPIAVDIDRAGVPKSVISRRYERI